MHIHYNFNLLPCLPLKLQSKLYSLSDPEGVFIFLVWLGTKTKHIKQRDCAADCEYLTWYRTWCFWKWLSLGLPGTNWACSTLFHFCAWRGIALPKTVIVQIRKRLFSLLIPAWVIVPSSLASTRTTTKENLA